MKPSMDEVLQKLIELNYHRKTTDKWIYVEQLAEELYTHHDNIIPSLLMLERDELIHFSSNKRLAVTVVRKAMAA